MAKRRHLLASEVWDYLNLHREVSRPHLVFFCHAAAIEWLMVERGLWKLLDRNTVTARLHDLERHGYISLPSGLVRRDDARNSKGYYITLLQPASTDTGPLLALDATRRPLKSDPGGGRHYEPGDEDDPGDGFPDDGPVLQDDLHLGHEEHHEEACPDSPEDQEPDDSSHTP